MSGMQFMSFGQSKALSLLRIYAKVVSGRRYCVSTNSCRPLVPAEKQFFEHDRGNGMHNTRTISTTHDNNPLLVPAIVVFTKIDGLEAKAYSDLKREKLNGGDAYKGRVARANQLLQEHFVQPIMEMVHPPMGLHKLGGQCAELTRKTVEALKHNQNLQMMFVLASKYDLEARLKAAVNGWQIKGTDEEIIRSTIIYFPHVWYSVSSV
ncbi:hypothetical protein FRB93_010524 [Tulasnella sp. JGI-2019a]|nr:hypothetical protein FRB93_010524 [Tulasnella sp. JGI-2019a]